MAPDRAGAGDAGRKLPGATVAIIGGGIAGLVTAFRLGAAGRRVTVFEAGASLGGLGDTFDHQGHPLERFYHCMLPTDRHLLAVLDELGLAEGAVWKPTTFGIQSRSQLYPLNTPADLLRFRPLSIIDRFRVGLTGVWGSLRSARGLDDMTCEAWLTGLSGKRAFDGFWRPMLEAKFGDRYREVPALWFWTRFNREKGAKVERKGYPRGGYRAITDRLAARLTQAGTSIRMRTPVERLALGADGRPRVRLPGGQVEDFDQLVYAGPNALLSGLADLPSLGASEAGIGAGIDMQGVVNAVLLLRRGLTPHYWVATVDPDIPFQGIVETTNLIDREHTGGAHLIYLMQYLHRDDPVFATSDAQLLERYWQGLKSLFPGLGEGDLIDSRLFRSPFVEPIYRLGYQRRKPAITLVPGRVFLATTAQVYPEVTSWNGSCRLAEEVATAVLGASQASVPSPEWRPTPIAT